VWTIGAYSLIAGAALLVLAFQLHRLGRLADR
jgi:hypothetical protein